MTRYDPSGTLRSRGNSTGGTGSRGLTVDLSGQSTVLGFVLLIGIVGAASVGILIVGVDTTKDTTQESRDERVEGAFVQFDKQVATAVRTDGDTRTVDFDLDEGAVRKQATGRIVVETAETNTVLVNQTVGSVVYDGGDRPIAYQAGGVWRGEGANATFVSSPEIEYRRGTLVFPIAILTGPTTLSGDEVTIRKQSTVSPLASPTLVANELVTIRITSDYYGGWADFFRSWTNDAAVTVDHANETVVVELGRPEIDGDFEDGVLATGGADGDVTVGTSGNASIHGPAAAEGSITVGSNPNSFVSGDTTENRNANLQPLDTAIKWKLENVENDSSTVEIDPEDSPSNTRLKQGKTYLDEDDLVLDNETMVVDLNGGNVTLVVDGDVVLRDGGEIRVENKSSDAAFRVYVTGDYKQKNSEAYVESMAVKNAEGLQIYGTSSMEIGIGGGGSTYFEGTIYAPRYTPENGPSEPNDGYLGSSNVCDGTDACVAVGNPTVVGSIVSGPTVVQQSAQLYYDTGLEDVEPTLLLDRSAFPPPITYLHLSLHEMEIDDGEN